MCEVSLQHHIPQQSRPAQTTRVQRVCFCAHVHYTHVITHVSPMPGEADGEKLSQDMPRQQQCFPGLNSPLLSGAACPVCTHCPVSTAPSLPNCPVLSLLPHLVSTALSLLPHLYGPVYTAPPLLYCPTSTLLSHLYPTAPHLLPHLYSTG